MKKQILLTLFTFFLLANTAFAYDSITTDGIKAYRSGNLVKCLQTMDRAITYNQNRIKNNIGQKSDNNKNIAVAKYYKAITYARIGDKEKSRQYYNAVISLHAGPDLILASQKGIQCLDDPNCLNKPLSSEEKFQNADPDSKLEAFQNMISDESQKKLTDYRLKRIKEMANQTGEVDPYELMNVEDYSPMPSRMRQRSEAPSDKDIAEAVKVLSQAGMLNINPNPTMAYTGMNNEMMQMNAMFSQGKNSQYDMLPLMMMYQGQNGTNKMSPEAMKMMMTNMMMPDFSSFDNNKF